MSNCTDETLRRALVALESATSRLEEIERAQTEPIAIIGIGCRYPGGGCDPGSYWRCLHDGVDAVSETSSRWVEQMSGRPPQVRWAGLLPSVGDFDAEFFGLSPREASKLDPQHRLLLEVAWEALEDAAYDASHVIGSRAGVFIGISTSDYAQAVRESADRDAYDLTGNSAAFAAGRLSYFLGLQGPCVSIDTVCSSSLVAVHLACQSLRSRESDLALAGGVNLILSPRVMEMFVPLQALSPDGKCRAFDASANGFVRGEGCGVLVMERLSDAQKSGRCIWAVVRGSAVNQDGRSTGLTTPNVLAQEAVVRQALKHARTKPSEIGYIETHGTGTALGDPIEFEALKRVFGREGDDLSPCMLGAVKTNLGHLEAAAGLAGITKAVLALHHGHIPRNLHFRTLNPHISLRGTRFALPTEGVPWPAGRSPRRAGVSSFGMSGTNAHVVLEEAPARGERADTTIPQRPLHLLTISAKTDEALRELTVRYAEHMRAASGRSLGDVCHTAGLGRRHFEERLAVLAVSAEEAARALGAFANGETNHGCVRGHAEEGSRPKVAFLFTGQGAQYVGMGRELYESLPVYREAIDLCASVLDRHLRRPLLDVVFGGDPNDAALDKTEFTQPALFAVEYALAAVWRSWGVEPDAVIGHSIGEYVAACVAGVFTLEEALELVARRGQLIAQLPNGGSMASVRARAPDIQGLLHSAGLEISIAAQNGADQVVVSGASAAVRTFCDKMIADGIQVRQLRVSHAFHSALMDPALDQFEQLVEGVSLCEPKITLLSNLTGEPVTAEVTSPRYWRRHLRESVQFGEGMRWLRNDAVDTFLEVGPHPVLLGIGAADFADDDCVWLPSLHRRRPAWRVMLESLAQLYVRGFGVKWDEFDTPYALQLIRLPTYPFQRRRHWVDSPAPERAASSDVSAARAMGEAASAMLEAADLLSRIQVVSEEEGRQLVRSWLRTAVAQVLRVEGPDAVHPSKGFRDQGMDSLMAVELRKRVERALGIKFGVNEIFDYPAVDKLATRLFVMISKKLQHTPVEAEARQSSGPSPVNLDVVTDDEARRMLEETLSVLEESLK